MLAALGARRWFSSVKRSIPYVQKGNWKLPALNADAPRASIDAATNKTDKWGTPVTPAESTAQINVPKDWRKLRGLPGWKRQMFSLEEKFPEGWKPRRKLSRDEMDELRSVKVAQPQLSLNELGNMFRISPEAVRRILRSKWRADPETDAKMRERWLRRGVRLGSPKLKPPSKQRRRLADPGRRIF